MSRIAEYYEKTTKLVSGLCLMGLTLSAVDDCGATPIKVGLFADPVATDKRSCNGVQQVVGKATDMTLERITSETILSDKLKAFDVLVFPGGTANGEARALGKDGGAAVEAFVKSGKGYIGICAGAYLMNEGWNELTSSVQLINGYCYDLDNWQRGEGQIHLKFVEPYEDLLTSETIWYENGPIFAPAKLDLPAYTALARFATDYTADGGTTGTMIGHDAIVAAPYHKGRAVGFSPHPELSPAFGNMLLSAIRWASCGNDGSQPTVKSVLLNNDNKSKLKQEKTMENHFGKALKIEGNKFTLDGQDFVIHSGAMHYFRTMPEDWHDRLDKMKKCGLNTVETYVPWNLHEPEEGQFCFEGLCDIERFIKTAHDVGLYVIVRPGPYICAEWEFGGLPYWLLNEPGMSMRCNDAKYLSKVDAYFDELIPRIVPFLSTKLDGNVLAMQIENEYGSYGSDKKYLAHLRDGLKRRGVDTLLFTSDGDNITMLSAGTIDGAFKTINFGSGAQESFDVFDKLYPNKPRMCTEYWDGWFDHWGEKHHTRDAESVVKDLKYMVEHGISFNYYMFHGGTNFGFMNGANSANDGTKYEPTVTSYDYDCAMSEWGEPTEKYWSIKAVLNPDDKVDFPNKCGAFGKFSFNAYAELMENLDALSKPVETPNPLTFEKLHNPYGYVLYRHVFERDGGKQPVVLTGLKDRAQIYVDGKFVGDSSRNDLVNHEVEATKGLTLDILVENMGRVNYGASFVEEKGLTHGVWFGCQYLHGFANYALPMNNLDKLTFKSGDCETSNPIFLKSDFEIKNPKDTFLKLHGCTKGVAYINGFNLGRYWEIGPQQTLYVPGALLRDGKNELIVFDQYGTKDASFELTDKHLLSK